MPVTVIPPPAGRGRVALAAALGICSGALGFGVQQLGSYTSGSAAALAANAATLGPALLGALCIGTLSVRARTALLCGAAFGFGLGIGDQLTGTVQDTTGAEWAADSSGWTPLAMLLGDALFGLTVGAVAAGAWWAVRHFWRLVPHEGKMCRRCGYSIGAGAISACPECGTQAGGDRTPARVWGWIEGSKRRGWVTLTLVIFAGLLWLGLYLSRPSMRRARAFYRQFPTPLEMTPVALSGQFEWFEHCPGSWVRLSEDGTQGISITYLLVDKPGYAAMELRLCTHSHTRFGDDSYVTVPSGLVSRLNREQADDVVAHGIPPGLLDAFRATPTPPSGRAETPISPDPYFPLGRSAR